MTIPLEWTAYATQATTTKSVLCVREGTTIAGQSLHLRVQTGEQRGHETFIKLPVETLLEAAAQILEKDDCPIAAGAARSLCDVVRLRNEARLADAEAFVKASRAARDASKSERDETGR
ncbi:hypothetical protein [Ruegeria sp. HKCCA6707]|uniref:hypothetical protein n=1 Tax=Ruegeria sp. HKCCA6707 TaxID=2682996 RepID=UPI0014888D4D|nr:hypothetical protein [Ruegeria sp. HKCCA6707]